MTKFTKRTAGVLLASCMLALASVAVKADDKKPAPESQGSIKVAKGTKEAALPALAKISIAEAIASAQKKVPGKALKVELEGDEGSLVYSVEIVGADQQITEVLVDAGDGKVLGVEMDDEGKEGNKDKKDPKDGEDEKDGDDD